VTHTHDVVLIRTGWFCKEFRIYGRPMPNGGDTITLPVDGRLISARVTENAACLYRNQKWSISRPSDATEIEELVV